MNIHLVNFYKTWLHWAMHENASNPAKFDPKYGLCNNIRLYLRWLNIHFDARWSVMLEMEEQFEAAGLSPQTPFSEGIMSYYNEPDKRKNPSRIQWCIDRIAEAEGHD